MMSDEFRSESPRDVLATANINLPLERLRQTRSSVSGEPARSLPLAASTPSPTESGPVAYLAVKGELHQQLLDDLDRRGLLGADEEQLAEVVHEFVEQSLQLQELPLNTAERGRLVEDLLEETLGVGPLATLMADPAVTDILVNGPYQVFIERFGRLEPSGIRFRDVEHLVNENARRACAKV